MAFEKIGESTFTVAVGESSESKNLPGSPQTGDIVIVGIANDNSLTADGYVLTSGYTNIEFENVGAPGHQLAYKVMGTPSDTVVLIDQRLTSVSAGVIQVWRGQNADTILDVARTVATGADGLPDCPSITPITAGALIFAVGLLDDDDDDTITAPTGYTNLVFGNAGQGSVNGCTAMIASKLWSGSGAEDPGIFGGSGSDAWRAVTFALRPAAAGGVSIPVVMANYRQRRT